MRLSLHIPVYNEEKTVEACLQSCLSQSRPFDEIIVIDDGSTDNTPNILNKYRDQIDLYRNPHNSGNKSYVQDSGMQLVTGDVVVMTDADTVLNYNFAEEIEKSFEDDSVDAVAGYVQSAPYNWLTALRELEYILSQDIHKKAENDFGAILVAPGAASAFRTKTFRKYVNFDHDTLTEDLDFTHKLLNNKRKIVFNEKAIVYTQDPSDINSYINQMRRWYGGNWQNLKKHIRRIKSVPRLLESLLVYGEGFLYPYIVIVSMFLSPDYALSYLVFSLGISLVLGLYGAVKRKRIDLLLVSPLLPILIILNSYIFHEQFFKEIVLGKSNTNWFKPERKLMVVS